VDGEHRQDGVEDPDRSQRQITCDMHWKMHCAGGKSILVATFTAALPIKHLLVPH
jgi:hypothetical protein